MKGGFNKLLRNIVASTTDTEYEKRLTKATFHIDSKEPKEKHVIYVMECMNGEHPKEIAKDHSLRMLIERHNVNIDDWTITTKVFIIFHRALQNVNVNRVIYKELKKFDHKLVPFYKNTSDKEKFRNHTDVSKAYCKYIRKYLEMA
jgi:hypothetical protein